QGITTTIAVANFGIDRTSTISSRDDGPCHIERRRPGPGTFDSAGTVTISGATGGNIVLAPDSNNHYSAMSQGLKYAADEVLSISSTGATVPPFSAQVTFPARLTVTSPTTLTTLNKSGFSASWTGTTGSVIFRISQYPNGSPETHIDCVFDGTAGTGAVPGSA